MWRLWCGSWRATIEGGTAAHAAIRRAEFFALPIAHSPFRQPPDSTRLQSILLFKDSSEKHKIFAVENSPSSGISTRAPTISAGTQGPPFWFRRDWLLGLILILFVILAYTPVWKAGFVWDDETILTANPCIVG